MNFPGGRKTALSYTFDDGTMNHVDVVAPLLEQYGIRATFYVIAGLVKDKRYLAAWDDEHGRTPRTQRMLASWEDIRGLMKAGHEIGNHSLTHKRMWMYKRMQTLECEVESALGILDKKLGVLPRSWAWPYMKRRRPVAALVKTLHVATRPNAHTLPFTKRTNLARANTWIDKAIEHGGWWFMCIHEVAARGIPTRPWVLEGNLQYAKAHEKDIWIAPVAEIAEWMRRHK